LPPLHRIVRQVKSQCHPFNILSLPVYNTAIKAQKLSSDRTKSDEDDYEVYFWNQVLFQYIYGVAGPLNTYLVRNNNTAFNRHHIRNH
jgi:hypothetical protein